MHAFLSMRFYIQYLMHALRAQSRYQVHSPRVYALIEQVFRHPQPDPICLPIEQLRARLLRDHRSVWMQDYGAGSQAHQHQRPGRVRQETVSSIARRAAKPPVLAWMLFQLCRTLKPAMVVELGTSLGLTTAYLAKAAPQASIITVEGAGAIAQQAQQHFHQLGLDHIQLLHGTFSEAIPNILSHLSSPFLLFVDGDHRYESTIAYVRAFLPFLHEGSCIVVDDIHWSREMVQAWKILCTDDRVNLSIDLFFMGLLFQDAGRFQPEHFRLRYPALSSWFHAISRKTS